MENKSYKAPQLQYALETWDGKPVEINNSTYIEILIGKLEREVEERKRSVISDKHDIALYQKHIEYTEKLIVRDEQLIVEGNKIIELLNTKKRKA